MTEKISGVAACVFDAYGTLFDVHAPVRRMAGRIGPDAEALTRLWRQKQLEYTWLRSLMGTHADFWQVTADALAYALESFKLGDERLHADLMQLYLGLDAYPDAITCVRRLRERGLRCAILSNGSPSMLEAAVKAAGMQGLFSAVLSVEEVGIYKPARRVYRFAVDRTGAGTPERICFVSANPWDAQGAAAYGFQVARVDRFGLLDDRIPGRPRMKIANLDELPPVIV